MLPALYRSSARRVAQLVGVGTVDSQKASEKPFLQLLTAGLVVATIDEQTSDRKLDSVPKRQAGFGQWGFGQLDRAAGGVRLHRRIFWIRLLHPPGQQLARPKLWPTSAFSDRGLGLPPTVA